MPAMVVRAHRQSGHRSHAVTGHIQRVLSRPETVRGSSRLLPRLRRCAHPVRSKRAHAAGQSAEAARVPGGRPSRRLDAASRDRSLRRFGASRGTSRRVHRRDRSRAWYAGSRARLAARGSHEERVLGNACGGNVSSRRAAASNQVVTALLFWSSVVLLGYTYVGYPALIGGWARWRPRVPMRSDATPTVSIVIVAHNEGRKIRD